MIAQQISVRLANKQATGREATHRDIEILQHCEDLVKPFGVALVAAVEEWAAVRKSAPDISLSDAVRFYATNGPDRFPNRSTAQVADEFVASLERKGVSDSYVSCARGHLEKFSAKVTGRISEVTVADINHYLGGLKHLSPVSKNGIRRNVVTMFSFAKKHGYIHPDRKTAAELSEKFKEDESEIAIFTPEEMERILLATHHQESVTAAAGGAKVVQQSPFTCRHLSMLARYRDPLPPTESIKLRLGLLEAARFAIDAAMGSLGEIRFEVGQLRDELSSFITNK